jgi:hypothetical protein
VGRKPDGKTVSLRTETAYKADALGKMAQRINARGSGVEVNAEVAQPQFAFLSGEISLTGLPGVVTGARCVGEPTWSSVRSQQKP